MSVIPELLAANERYAASRSAAQNRSPPRRRVAILTCMDARLLPGRFLGLEEGDAHLIRNAGGRASDDALRSLILSCRLLGTREFLVIHHTDCGLLGFDGRRLQEELERETGADASQIDFMPFSDLEESVRQDVDTIRRSPFIPREIPVTGYVFEVETGRIRRVE